MEMKAITVYVPDNGCNGCDFLSCSYYESYYKNYQEMNTLIFFLQRI